MPGRETVLLLVSEAPRLLNEAEALEQRGYGVVGAATGGDALKAVRGSAPIDLVLISVSRGQGADRAEIAKEILEDHDMPVLFLLDGAEEHDIEETQEVSSHGYVTRDSGIAVLDASIRGALRLHRGCPGPGRPLFQGDGEDAGDAPEARLHFLQHLIDTIPNPVFYKDRNGVYQGCNKAFAEHVGLPRERIAGRTVFEVHPDEVAELYFRKDSDLFASGGAQTYDASVRLNSGARRDIIMSKATYNDAGDNIAGLIGVIVDITDRKHAEERLRESEEKYRRLFDDAVLGVFQTTPGGRIITGNAAHARMFGYSSPEELRTAVSDVGRDLYADPSLRPQVVHMIEEAGQPIELESRYKRKDGSTFVGLLHAWGARDSRGGLILEGFIEDITDRHIAEEKLRESEEKYRSIFENAVEGVFQCTPEGRFLRVNQAMAKMYGYGSPEEMVGSITDIGADHYANPEDLAKFREIIERDGRVEKGEHQVYRRDGIPIWISTNALAVRDGQGITLYYEGTDQDITLRKQAEEALKVSERNLRTILDCVDDAVCIQAMDGKIVDVNEKMLEMFRVDREDILLMTIDKDLSVQDSALSNLPGIWESVVKGKERAFEWKARRPRDGSSFCAEVVLRKISLNNEDVVLATVHDITERKQVGKTLHEKEVFLRQGEGIARLGGWKVNPETGSLVWTEGIYDILETPPGYKPVFPDALNVFAPEYIPTVRESIMRAFTDGAPFTVEVEVIVAEGRRLWAELRGLTRMEEEQGATVVGTLQDITSRKKAEREKLHLEAQLRQSQKMEAIGTLAGGIAHDFNNILTAIIGYSSLLQMDVGAGDARKRYVDNILTASQKAASLTQGLLAFSRKQAIELKPRKLDEMIRGAEKILKRLLTEDIEFEVSLAAGDAIVMSDIGQIDQVLMNLATNARDAMPRGGKLFIETKEVYLDDEFVQFHGFGETGSHVLISVIDTGAGMDGKTREKIFEPFFTTKEVGKGTGLGLSIVYGIITQHNGYITAYSEPDHGTTFAIYLPTTKAGVEGAKQPRKDIGGGTETVLVAEDNDQLRALIKELLERKGYGAIEAADGQEALQAFAKHGHGVDLIILDVVMPRKNGKEVYEEIRRVAPNMQFLFTSGYTRDIILDKGIEDSTVDFIKKPLSPNELLLKVREVLDR